MTMELQVTKSQIILMRDLTLELIVLHEKPLIKPGLLELHTSYMWPSVVQGHSCLNFKNGSVPLYHKSMTIKKIKKIENENEFTSILHIHHISLMSTDEQSPSPHKYQSKTHNVMTKF